MVKRELSMAQFDDLCRRLHNVGAEFEYAGEGSLLAFDMAVCEPCKLADSRTTFAFVVCEKYLNPWSSCYEVTRYTPREWNKVANFMWAKFAEIEEYYDEEDY